LFYYKYSAEKMIAMNLQRLDNSLPLKPITMFNALPSESLAGVLARAYHGDSAFKYVIPDSEARHILSPWVFRSAVRTGRLYGEVLRTQMGDGAAVWFSPFYDVSLRQIVRDALLSMPFKVDRGIIRRTMKLGAHLQEVREWLAPIPHWYLMFLGATASEESSIGAGCIEPILLRADSAGIPCYLETFDEEKLGFYKGYGFRITGAGRIAGDGPNFWAMTRAQSISSLPCVHGI
jgi:hypothetical protein